MSIEISRPTNPLPTCIPPKMSPQTGTLPPCRPLIRCLTISCFKKNQCSPRNHRQYRDSHYHFPQPMSSRPPTLCSVCRILSAARTSGTPLRSKHKWQGREPRFHRRTPYHRLFPGTTYGQAVTITRCPRRRKCPPTCRTSSFKDRTHTQSPSKSSIAPQDSTTSCTISGCLHSPTPGVIEIVRMPVLGVLARCVICHDMVLLHFHSICRYSPHQLHCLLTTMPAGRIVVIIWSHKR